MTLHMKEIIPTRTLFICLIIAQALRLNKLSSTITFKNIVFIVINQSQKANTG